MLTLPPVITKNVFYLFRMSDNKLLHRAKRQKKDEFYTQLSDIERELKHYKAHFAGKIVYCNCDDPYESNFFKFFAANFNTYRLKKLIATCYRGSPISGEQLSLDHIEGMYSNVGGGGGERTSPPTRSR